MVRFIDLGDQITTDGTEQFAWFDTITDEFMEFNGCQVWESWDEFVIDFVAEGEPHKLYPLKRFRRLYGGAWR